MPTQEIKIPTKESLDWFAWGLAKEAELGGFVTFTDTGAFDVEGITARSLIEKICLESGWKFEQHPEDATFFRILAPLRDWPCAACAGAGGGCSQCGGSGFVTSRFENTLCPPDAKYKGRPGCRSCWRCTLRDG